MTLNELLARKVTYNEARYFYTRGVVSQEVWDAYRHVWQTSAPRFSFQACFCKQCCSDGPIADKETYQRDQEAEFWGK